jgi:hypothetical protein
MLAGPLRRSTGMKRFSLLLALSACDDSAPAPPSPLPIVDVAPSASVAAAQPAGIDPAAVKDAVARWAKAQNDGDFAAYRALYADKMEGVKRAGPRATRFARDGWLKDRERMFAKRMQVEVSNIEVTTSKATAQAVFTQRFASGTFEDLGPKSLVFVAEPGGLVITREEMLASTIAGEKKKASLPFASFAHVLEAGGFYAVVASHKPKAAWEQGKPTLVEIGPPTIAVAGVKVTELPADVAALRGKKLRLMRAGGVACEGAIDGFAVVGRVVASSFAEMEWRGQNGEPAWTADAVAADAWTIAEKHLAARIVPESGDCKGALWAHDAAEPAPVAATPRPAGEALKKSALDAFRALPVYATLQKSYGQKSRWEDAGQKPPEVEEWSVGARNFVSVTANVYTGSCAEFSGEATGIWEVSGDGRLQLANQADGGYVDLLAASEIGGEPFFVFDAGFHGRAVLRGTPTLQRGDAISLAYLACDC